MHCVCKVIMSPVKCKVKMSPLGCSGMIPDVWRIHSEYGSLTKALEDSKEKNGRKPVLRGSNVPPIVFVNIVGQMSLCLFYTLNDLNLIQVGYYSISKGFI